MVKYYEDQQKEIINPVLLDEDARKKVSSFLKPKSGKRLTSSQIRKYFNEVKSLKLKIEKLGFNKVKPSILLLKSKAAYDCPVKGSKKNIPEEFKEFIFNCVDSIKDEKDFEAFALYFEAIVGYFYGEGGGE